MLLFFMIAIGTALVAEEDVKDEKFTLPELEKVLLAESEMPEHRLGYQHKRSWPIGMKEDIVQERIGVGQSWVSSSRPEIKIRVNYCVFNSNQEALDAATFYVSFMQWPFKEGSLTGLPLGDKSWIATQQSQGAAIMTVRGNKAVLIGNSLYREGERKHLEDIMRMVIAKIEKSIGVT